MLFNHYIMNIKNIAMTSGMTILFGLYSLYNILDYLNNIETLYKYKILELQKNLDETDKKYKQLQVDFVNITDTLDNLNDKIVIVEKKIVERQNYCFTPNYEFYDSSEDEKKLNKHDCQFTDYIPKDMMNIIIKSENNNLENINKIVIDNVENNNTILIDNVKNDNLENVNKIVIDNVKNDNVENNNTILNEYVENNNTILIDNVKNDNTILNEYIEYDCIELSNINYINTLRVSQCSNTKDDLTDYEKADTSTRSRSLSLSDVNWANLMKKFLLG
jgi:hypothetical protein